MNRFIFKTQIWGFCYETIVNFGLIKKAILLKGIAFLKILN